MNKMKIYAGKKFKDLTTFHIGGKIKFYTEVKSKEEIHDAVEFAKRRSLKIFVLGGGSDILASDKYYDGIVIKCTADNVYDLGGGKIKAQAGVIWDDLVGLTIEKNLQGIECLSGIPGTVGASPIQNIGAYGQELKDSFLSLTAFDVEKGNFVEFSNSDCKFSYRHSFFKDPRNWQKYIIYEVIFNLKPGGELKVAYESLKKYLIEKKIENPTLSLIRQAVLEIRSGKFENPKDIGNAGSFFQNPTIDAKKMLILKKKYPDIPCYDNQDGTFKCFAGWFIEQAGWKGKRYGGAGVSTQHALILVNVDGSAKASEVYELSEKIIADVYQKFGVRLEREVQLINFS